MHLRDMLKEKVHRRGANNIEELWKHCKEEWDSLPTETIEKLYDSMPTRIRAVVAARGGNTKYCNQIVTDYFFFTLYQLVHIHLLLLVVNKASSVCFSHLAPFNCTALEN